MDINRLDLNLLLVFSAMLKHQNVTRAGRAMGLSQPAMSAALAKLRQLFNEQLFVRGSGGMTPTPRALELAEPIQRVLDVVRGEIMQASQFDPRTTERTFSIATADLGEIVLLPKMLKRLSLEAPATTLQSVALSPAEVAEHLESGSLDLAIGYFPSLTSAGIFQQRLYRYPFVCIARADHPAIGDRITLKQFLSARHAVRREAQNRGVIEELLQERGLKRRVQLYVSHFTSLPAIIAESDLIATVPRSLGLTFLKLANIKLVEPPFKTPANHVKQYWHRRFHRDPANMWLREMVGKLFSD